MKGLTLINLRFLRTFVICSLVGFAMSKPKAPENIRIEIVRWPQLQHKAQELAELFFTVYLEYPYFFPGPGSACLEIYANSATTLASVAYDGNNIIGICLGISARDGFNFYFDTSFSYYHRNLHISEMDDNTMFYVGDLILLPAYRNKGIGKKMYQLFEKEIAQHYRGIYLCIIDNADESLKPVNYIPTDLFWESQGYKRTRMWADFVWQHINDTNETFHHMIFWFKDLL